MLYRVGLIVDPCGAPASRYIVGNIESFTFTRAVRLVTKVETHLMKFIGKLSFVSFSRRPPCHIVSNAILMSKAANTVANPRL